MIVNNGYVPPPHRVVTHENAKVAIEILNTAPKGSTVHFEGIGSLDDKEILPFFKQISGLFASSTQWQIVGNDWAEATIGARGIGIGCSVPKPPNVAGEIAMRALAASGHPCAHTSLGMGEEVSADIHISIGTRIDPPK
jgi:hypothetical protein